MRFVWDREAHTSRSGTRENGRTRRRHGRVTRGRRTVGGVDDTPLWRRHATRQPIHQTTHADGYRETYQRGETDNVGVHAVRTKVLHTSSTAHGRYTHSRLRGSETLTRRRERRERSSASTLQHPPTETRPPGEKSSPVADRSQEEHNEGAWDLGCGPARLRELGPKGH